ncbi:GldG family protein [Ghiorsea bivora]|uniref:GldG family protein n=1 Tax=Ghiorsea bivora TaxID=1485545 RepID=UPI00068A9C31|nr:GldG family protein [Ghiorsea bivora]
MADLRSTIRRKTLFTLSFVVVIAVLLFAAAQGSHIRSDWSDNQTSSISASTKQVLQSLDEPIQIKAYFTAGLPQPYGQLKQFVEDTLMNYRDAAKGKLGFEMINPEDNPNTQAALQALQIPKVQVQVIEDDRAQVRQAYLAIVIEYLDKQEIIPVVQTDAGFEYLLTRKIKKLTGKGKQTIAVATGFGAKSSQQLQTLQQLLQDDYNFVDVDLAAHVVPSDAKALIVAGVDKKPSEMFRYHLDQFRMTGNGVLVLASNVEPNLQAGFQVLPVDTYANDWLLSDLGVSVEPGLVMDQQASRITVNQQQAGFAFRSVVDFPFIPNVVNLNKQSVITQGLESVSMPFAAPLAWGEPSADKSILLQSSEWSAVQSGPPFDVNPLLAMQERFHGLHMRPQTLMLAQEGKMQSAFTKALDDKTYIAKVANGRLLVSGSSALLDNEFINGENTVLILNMLDWLSHDEALITLRSKGVTQRPLEPLNKAERTFFKVVWVFALPALLLTLAGWRWLYLRKRRNKTWEENQ